VGDWGVSAGGGVWVGACGGWSVGGCVQEQPPHLFSMLTRPARIQQAASKNYHWFGVSLDMFKCTCY
jgi:hypothetical protein